MWGNKKIKSHVSSLVKKDAKNVRKKQVKEDKVLK